MKDIITEIRKRNSELGSKLDRAIWNLKDKLEKHKESARILIRAGELLDYGLLIEESYGNFSIVIDADKTLVIYHDYNHSKKCIAWYDMIVLAHIKDISAKMDAYSTIEIYKQLSENIEKLIDKAFTEIKNRYDKKEKEYCNK